MSLLITSENYNGQNFPSQNGMDWVDAKVKVLHFIEYLSNTIQKSITVNNLGSDFYFQLLDGTGWADHGFSNNGSVSVISYDNGTPTTISTTIDYLDGDKVFFTSNPTNLPNGQFPQLDNTGTADKYIEITQTSAPEKLEFDFNLTRSSNATLNSLIDDNLNRFSSGNIGSLAVGNSVVLNQVNLKSGGLIEEVELTLVSNINNKRSYSISFKFMVWTVKQADFNTPQYFNGVDTVGCINRFRMFSEYNNNNTVMTSVSQNTQGNVGLFDENFNTGSDSFDVISFDLEDVNNNLVSNISYTDDTLFTAVVQNLSPNAFSTINSRFTIAMFWDTVNSNNFQNKNTNIGNNLAIVAPDFNFQHNQPPSGAYNGYVNTEFNFSWSLSDLEFNLITGSTQVQIKGRIIPNNVEQYFDTLSLGEKNLKLSFSHFRTDVDRVNQLSSSVILYNGGSEASIIEGEELKIQEEAFVDHAGNRILRTLTTEDDVRYSFGLELIKNQVYENASVGVKLENQVTGEFFYFERYVFNLTNTPFVNGIHQVNETIQRNFNLPPTSDKNTVSAILNTSFSDPTLYRIDFVYGFLSDWRYWLAESNADSYFYDMNQPNNGLNKNWQKYLSDLDWKVMIDVKLVKDGVADFYERPFDILPYEDDDVSESITFESNGAVTTTPVANSIVNVEHIITWNSGVFDPSTFWVEITVEDYEGGNRWVFSSELPQGNILANPLKPTIPTQLVEFVIVGNVATLNYILDTNVINANAISLGFRIFS